MKDLVKVAAENLVGIYLDIDIPEASRKVDLEEFGIKVSELPASALVEIEGAKLIDPTELRVFRTIKQRMWRAYNAPGLKFMGGRAMSKSTAEKLCKVLEAEIEAANAKKQEFTDSFWAKAHAWAEKHPQFKDALEKALADVGNIGDRIKFDYVPFPIGTLSDTDSPMNQKIEGQILGLTDQLFAKNAARAAEIWRDSFHEERGAGEDKTNVLRSAVRASVLGPIRELRDNFADLAFIDNRAEPVVNYINHVLGALPAEGPYEGKDLNALQMLVLTLKNADMTKEMGEAIRNGMHVNDVNAFVAPFLGIATQNTAQANLPIEPEEAAAATPETTEAVLPVVEVEVVSQTVESDLVINTASEEMVVPATTGFSIPVFA